MTEQRPAGGGAAFATHVLRAALAAPGSDTPMAGATVLGLLAVLVSEGAVAEAAEVLGVAPGEPATFEVRTYAYGGAASEQHLTGLDAGAALRAVLEQSEADLVEAVAVAPSGLTRRVVERRRGSQPRYLWPSTGTYEGDAAAVATVLDRWRTSLAAPDGARSSAGQALAAVPSQAVAPTGPSHPATFSNGAGAAGGFDPAPEVVDLLRRSVRQALEEVTVEVDLGAMESVVAAAVGQLAFEPAGGCVPGTAPDVGRAAVEAPASPPPSAAQVAEEVVTRIRAATVGTATETEAEVRLRALSARLDAQASAFEDRLRATTRSLQALADDIAGELRGSEDYLGRLTHSVTAVVERVGRRLEGQLEQLPVRAPASRDLAEVAGRLASLVDTLEVRADTGPVIGLVEDPPGTETARHASS